MVSIIEISDRSPDPTWPRPAIDGVRVDYLVWSASPVAIDAGVPDEVAQRLGVALCAAADVLFLGGPAADLVPDPAWRACAVGTWCAAVRLPLRLRTPLRRRDIPLTFTRRPDVLAGAFDAPGFSWDLRGQTIWLFDPGSAPPRIDAAALDSGLDQDPPVALPFGSVGLLRPGTDGDFAELLTREPPMRIAVLDTLRAAA